jgi:parallel beta-helix repeat protein
MRGPHLVCRLLLLAGLLLVPASPAHAAAALELYGTFEAMGVVVTVAAADDPNLNAAAEVAYRAAGQGAYQPGFLLSRISEIRFAGSLFWLEPGTAYDVRVTFHDPDGGPLDGATVEDTASTRAELRLPRPLPGHYFYVGPAGSGTECSYDLPCSLAEGLSRAHAGDQVLLREGTYYEGELDLPRSGTAGAPIVIRGNAGETAVLDGGDPAAFSWTAQGGGVYHTTVQAPDPHLVTAGGQRLLPYQSLSDLQNLVWDTPGFYADGTDLYVRLAGDADPNGAAVVISRYNYAFYVEQDHIYFVDLVFRHYGRGSYAKAIYFNNASDNVVQDCTFALNDLGIGLKRDSHRNVIQDNEFYDTLFAWPWDAFYAGIALSSGGIRFYSPSTGRGAVIRRNTFHDYFDGFGVCPDEAGTATNETDVYDNLVYRAGDDGLETDGTCSNVRLWGNTFHDVLVGISLAPVYDGPVYALRNVVYRTGVGNNDYPGSPFKFNSSYPRSGPIYLFHNTADAVLPGNNGLDCKSPGSWDLVYGRNNVWSGTEYALSNANPDQPLDLDYDELYTTLSGELAWWAGLPDRHLETLAELQAATGQEIHGLNVAPGFVDAPGGDYRLAAGSGLVDAGLAIPGINPDYGGGAPDIGAYEFAPPLLLQGRAASETLYLSWIVNVALPAASTWRIAYDGPAGDEPPPITGIVSPTRAYTLTGLTDGAWYTVTLNAMLDNAPFLTDTVHLKPDTYEVVYLPLVLRTD